jgi:hypothetical protein
MRMAGNEWIVGLVSAGLLACSGDSKEDAHANEAPSSEEVDGSLHGQQDASKSDAGTLASDGSAAYSHNGDAAQSTSNACATVSTGVELEPVHLAFAFDVSGSMGSGVKAWERKDLKWDPVVLATRTFFASASSAGLTASLMFFPSTAGKPAICNEGDYEHPEVPMTALPSPLFGAAIDVVAPKPADDWRSGTPTVAVMRGTQAFLGSYRMQHEGRFAIVLVTDGYPEGCTGLDKVDFVVTEAALALQHDVHTYVVGVANPKVPDAPDTVSDLHRIAAAGGTDHAFLIATDDPNATASALTAAIDQIRKSSISCSLAIPPPSNGAPFDKRSVAVHYQSGPVTTNLSYDPACTKPNAWHYDDVSQPSEIVLCDSTCNTIRADTKAELQVEFACQPILVI